MTLGNHSRLKGLVPQLVLILFLFGPLLYLMGDALLHLLRSPELFALMLPTGRRLGLLSNSLILAATVSVSVAIIGIFAGSKLVYEQAVVWRWVKWIFLLTAPIPPYIHALVWSSTVGSLNNMLNPFGVSLSSYGFFMSYLVDTMAYLPLGVGLAMVGYMLVEAPAVEAARLYKEDARVFLEVVLPLASPMIFAALGFVFILVIADYSVPTLYSYNVYSLEIFSEFSASNNPAHSVLLSVPIVIIAVVVLVYSLRGLRNTVQSGSVNREGAAFNFNLPNWLNLLQLLAVIIILFQVVFLVGGLLLETGSFTSLYFAVKAATDDILVSGVIGFTGAILGTAFGYILFSQLRRGGLWWVLLAIPLALPSSIVGISLIDAYTKWAPQLYGTMYMPVIAVTTRFVALATIIIYAQSKRVDPLLFEAAELFKKSESQALWRVKLPLQKYGVLAACASLLAFSVGELGSTLLVVPPGNETVTIRIFNYLHYGGSEEVAGLCLLIVVLMMTMTGLAFKAFSGGRSK
jgi:iron(III) transport system permease protein